MVLSQSQLKTDVITDSIIGYPLDTAREFSLRIFRSLSELPSDWEVAQPGNNRFLQRPYLSVVEKYPPDGYEFCYLIIYRKNVPVGVCYCQILTFKTGTIRDENNAGAATKFISWIKNAIFDRISIRTLVCGNALLTGEHAFHFDAGIPKEEQYKLVMDALSRTRKYFDETKEAFNGFLLKDFAEENLTACKNFENRGFHRVEFQPNMVFDLNPSWTQFDDYLAAMTAKYRTRAKRAFKKGADFNKVNFTEDLIRLNHERIFELYQGIEKGAGFSFAHLNQGYFCGLKDVLGDDFSLTGYYLNEKLVGFYTTIVNGEELEAHFIGFEQSLNRTHQIYLNMLYDMVRVGIEKGAKRIIFARTALEIKSSVGAVAEDMYCYTRHWKNLPNHFIPKVFSYLNPIEEWTPRNPFKTTS